MLFVCVPEEKQWNTSATIKLKFQSNYNKGSDPSTCRSDLVQAQQHEGEESLEAFLGRIQKFIIHAFPQMTNQGVNNEMFAFLSKTVPSRAKPRL